LHTFAAGCTALTGIEVISNSVPAFEPPEARNARHTLLIMALLMGILFLGSVGLTQFMAVVARPDETILSALARRLLGPGPAYLTVQVSTLLILAVAANSSFTGFPRLAAILAGDNFLPRQLSQLGDRLVYNNGIGLLAAATGLLIVTFNGDSHALIPLFAIGVLLAFSLSQAGMVVHWWKERRSGWALKAAINAAGMLATTTAGLIVGLSKFLEGAWIIIFLVPVLVVIFVRIRGHFRQVGRELSLHGLPPSLRPTPRPRVVIPISGVHRGVIEAVRFARSIAADVTAVYVELEPDTAERMRARWREWFPDIPLAIVPSPHRSMIRPFMDFLDETDRKHHDGQLAVVVIPEFVPATWWHMFLHNQSAAMLKRALLYRRRHRGFQRVIIDVPYHIRS
jgi:hypothetical protein